MQNKAERPLSPHLQVYKPQMTSVLSILHRITGAFNAAGLVIFTLWLLSAAMGETYYALFIAVMNTWIGKLMLLGFTFTVFYHMCNGIRHLFWDMGYLFKIDQAYKAGYAVIFSSVILTAWFWVGICMN
jgi:succinate dehydrogenase / fumarate reductase cytochrome b subunit